MAEKVRGKLSFNHKDHLQSKQRCQLWNMTNEIFCSFAESGYKFLFIASTMLTMALNEQLKHPLVYGAHWLTGGPMEKQSSAWGIGSVPSLPYQQGTNVVGWTLKCPNGLHGPLTMQASIRGVSGAWLEQRDPLGLMRAVQGTVGCSSSSPKVFIYVIHLDFETKGEGKGGGWSL